MLIDNLRQIILGITFVGFCSVLGGQAPLAAQQRQDEKPRFGNGAILKRIFGEDDKAKQTAKETAERARNQQRENLDAARQRLKDDSDKIKEKLGFKSSPDDATNPKSPPSGGRISDSATARPNSQFAPQQLGQRSISDQGDPRRVSVNPTASVLRTEGNSSAANARSNRVATPPDELVARNGSPISGIRGAEPNHPTAAPDNSPRNQPRVPTQPTFAIPQNVPSQVQLPTTSPPSLPTTPQRGYGAFGIMAEESASQKGLLIKTIKPKSVAAHIGLLPGDLIKNVAGLDVEFVEEIDSLVEVLEPEDEFEISFVRNGKLQTKTFSLPQ